MKCMDLMADGIGGSKERNKTRTELFITELLDGSVLDRLQDDFPGIELQDKNMYMGYIETYWRMHPGNTFALHSDFKLQIVCTGILAVESLMNKAYRNLRLNNYLGFRVINTKTGHIMKVEKYSDLCQVLRRV